MATVEERTARGEAAAMSFRDWYRNELRRRASPAGIDPALIKDVCIACLGVIHSQLRGAGLTPAQLLEIVLGEARGCG